MRLTTQIISTIFLLLCTNAVHADQETFDELFGDQIKKVQETRDTADDIELAEAFVKYMDFDDIDLSMKIMLSDAAYELASKSTNGAQLAESILRMRVELAPDQSIEPREKLVAMLNDRLRRAPIRDRESLFQAVFEETVALAIALEKAAQPDKASEVYAKIIPVSRRLGREQHDYVIQARKRLNDKIQAKRELDRLKERLLNDPTEAVALEIAKHLVIYFDLPSEAAQYALAGNDEEWKKMIPLAARKDLDKAPASEVVELGVWYANLADDAPEATQAALYARTLGYLALVRESEALSGIEKLKVSTTYSRAEKRLEELGGAEIPGVSRGTKLVSGLNLLPIIRKQIEADPKAYQSWEFDGKILIRKKFSKATELDIPIQVSERYEVNMVIQPAGKNDGVNLRLPVQENRDIEIHLGGHIRTHKSYNRNVLAKSYINLDSLGEKHNVLVKVLNTPEKVGYQAFVNGELVDEWTGKVEELLREKNVVFMLRPTHHNHTAHIEVLSVKGAKKK